MSLKEKYIKEVKPALMKKFEYKSVMAIPTLSKIVVNMTAGRDVSNSKSITEVKSQLEAITGQKPFETRAHKSLASFKLREGMPMGGKVTLRGKNM
jgi:large subunit ribosomal protein L5